MSSNIIYFGEGSDDQSKALEILHTKGHRIERVRSERELFEKFNQGRFDVILFSDGKVPECGKAISKIRNLSPIPILALSANENAEHHDHLLSNWVDDVLSSKVVSQALCGKLDAWERRNKNGPKKAQSIKINDEITLDLAVSDAIKNGEKLHLPKKEFMILKLLSESPNRVFSKDEIYLAVWDSSEYDDGNLLNVHIRRLRFRLEKDPNHPELILTRWGIGYQLVINS